MAAFGHDLKRARKAHRCMICGEPIPKGSDYMRWADRVDGKTVTRKAHAGCEAVSLLVLDGERDMAGILAMLAGRYWAEVRSDLLRVGPDEVFRIQSFWEEAHHKPPVLLTEQAVHEGSLRERVVPTASDQTGMLYRTSQWLKRIVRG